jgi:hypothetical protein
MNRRENRDDSVFDEVQVLEDTYALLNEVSSIENQIQSQLRLQIPFFLNENKTKTRQRQYENVKFLNDTKRIEWEISRRIARVDREIRMNPPNKRPWFLSEQQQQQRKSRLTKSKLHQHAVNFATSSPYNSEQRRALTSVGLSERRPLVENKNMGNVSTPSLETKAEKVLVGTTQKKETTAMPKRGSIRDKENTPPTIVSRNNQEQKKDQEEEKDSPQSSSIREKSSSLKDEVVLSQQLTKKQETEKQPVQSNEAKSIDDKFKDLDIVLLDSDAAKAATSALEPTHPFKDMHERLSHEQHQQHQQYQQQEYEVSPPVPATSIGRQLLSENRTMTTPVSYGQPPELTIGTGRMKKKMLNPEVLRRVFSDLDTDRDGGLTRLEVGLAMHRFHISIHPKAIASFFRNLADQHPKGLRQPQRRQMGTKTKETINYKQFVAFVTVAHQNQMKFQATKPKAPAFTNRQSSTRPKLPPLTIPSSPLPSPSRSLTTRTRASKSRNIQQQYEIEPKQYIIKEESLPLEPFEKPQQQATTFLETLLPEVILTQVLSSPSIVQEREQVVVAKKEDEHKEMVHTLAKELILRHLKENPEAKRPETEPDLTGLSGLEAYLRQLQFDNPLENEQEEEAFVRASIDSFSLEKETKDQVAGVVKDLLGKIKTKPIPPPPFEDDSELNKEEDEKEFIQKNPAQVDDKKLITGSMDVEIQTEPEAIVVTSSSQPEEPSVFVITPPVASPTSISASERLPSKQIQATEEEKPFIIGSTWFGQLLYLQLPKQSLPMNVNSNRSILKKLRMKRKIEQVLTREKIREAPDERTEKESAKSHEEDLEDGHATSLEDTKIKEEEEEKGFFSPDDESNSGVLEKTLLSHQPSLFASSLENLTLCHSISSSESSFRSSNVSSSSSPSSNLNASAWQSRWRLMQHSKQQEEGSEGELLDQDSDLSDGEVYGSTKQHILRFQQTRASGQYQAQNISDADEEDSSEQEKHLVLEPGQLHHMVRKEVITI